MAKIKLSSIDPNPYRDFDTYPIDPDQVAMLESSMEETGWYGGMVVRKHPTEKGRYQLACAHHRRKAAENLGWDTIDCTVIKMDRDQMIDVMVRENLTQRGYNAAAIQDSVQAKVYMLVRNALSTIVEGTHAHKKLRESIVNGSGIGEKSVMAVMHDECSLREVRGALATMKTTGKMAKIIERVQEELEEEAKEAEEAAAKAKTEAARKKAQKKRKEADDAQKAVDETPADVLFDEACIHLFDNEHQAAKFREAVTSPHGQEYIPVDAQADWAKTILDQLQGEKKKGGRAKEPVSAERIYKAVGAEINKLLNEDRQASKEEKRRAAAESANENLRQLTATLRNRITALGSTGAELAKAYKAWDYEEEPTAPLLLRSDIDKAIKTLQDLRNYSS